MREGEIIMTAKEVKRLETIPKVDEKRLIHREAAQILGCTTRNIRYLLKRYRTEGPAGLLSKRRGKASNRAFSASFKGEVVDIVANKYNDFGPTLAAEMLEERDNIKVSDETIRKWMIEVGLWHNKRANKKKAHPPRERRHNYGSLVQIDGSPHDWFEGRSPNCTLIVFIDDATSRLQLIRFFPAETTFAYFEMTRLYIERYGIPLEYYSDRHSIFKVNMPEPESGTGLTQFGRAMEGIGINLIHANSPAAKGRVERANQTLQDRLVKEMRLDGIDNMEMANGEYLDKFVERYNAKFAVPPAKDDDLHCKIENLAELDLHLTHQEPRKLTKNCTISYKNKKYVIEKPDKARRLYQAQVVVCEAESGEITLRYKGESLEYKVYDKNQHYSQPVSRKELGTIGTLRPLRRYIPPADHPWRNYKIKQIG